MATFPNRAGDHPENDTILRQELTQAGIPILIDSPECSKNIEMFYRVFRDASGEVKTSIIGHFHGWTFKRAWYYWIAEGPGIEFEAANRLYDAFGTTVRVDGHCGCISPLQATNGLAVGLYHVDDQEGLNALAATIREIVEKYSKGN